MHPCLHYTGNVDKSSESDSHTQQTSDNIETKRNIVYGLHYTQTGNIGTKENQAYNITSRERDQDRPAAYDYV